MRNHRVPDRVMKPWMRGIRCRFATALVALGLALAGMPAAAQQALVSDDPRFCLGTDGALTPCTTAENRFTRTYYPRNAFVFATSSGCLDASGGRGNRVRLSSCDGSLAQDWFVVGNRRIQSKSNSLCLDVEGERFVAENPVVLWECRGNQRNQSFGLVEVPAATGNLTTVAAGRVNANGRGRGNVNAQGRGNVSGRGAGQIIGVAGGNVVGAGGGNVIGAGGGNVIGAGGGNVIAAGGYNVQGTSVGPAATGELSVSGQANILAAGQTVVPELYWGGGVLPPEISVAGMANVRFPTVTGTVTFGGGSPGGPDGTSHYPRTDIEPYGGISGVVHGSRIMFVAGVFLSGGAPGGPPPASRDLASDELEKAVAPALQQVFFIGDGKDPSGTVQVFAVPAGATRLHLGFADSNGFVGAPQMFGDNGGEVTVRYEVYPAG